MLRDERLSKSEWGLARWPTVIQTQAVLPGGGGRGLALVSSTYIAAVTPVPRDPVPSDFHRHQAHYRHTCFLLEPWPTSSEREPPTVSWTLSCGH